MALNEYQKDILEFYCNNPRKSIGVLARAGTGKSTLSLHLYRSAQDVKFLVFTNSTKNSLIGKGVDPIDVMTTYSLGLKTLKSHFLDKGKNVNFNVQSHKYGGIAAEYLESFDCKRLLDRLGINPQPYRSNNKDLIASINNVINLLLLNLIPQKPEGLFCESVKPLLESEGLNPLIGPLVYQILKLGNKATSKGIINFSEMVAIPAYMGAKLPKSKTIIVDESQDTSKAQLYYCLNSFTDRLVFLGDNKQSIYGFAGATSDSMNLIKDSVSAKMFPMPLSYRIPISVCDMAKNLVPDIQTAISHKGEIQECDFFEGCQSILEEKRGLVISRTNLNLLRLAVFLLSEKVPFTFTKDTLVQQLKNKLHVAEKIDKIPFRDLLGWLDTKKTENYKNRFLLDIYLCLEYCLSNSAAFSYGDLKKFFKKLERNPSAGLCLTTAHSSKGMENDVVFVWGTGNFPHPKAQTKEELRQESNLWYVAVTRSRDKLYLVDLDDL